MSMIDIHNSHCHNLNNNIIIIEFPCSYNLYEFSWMVRSCHVLSDMCIIDSIEGERQMGKRA